METPKWSGYGRYGWNNESELTLEDGVEISKEDIALWMYGDAHGLCSKKCGTGHYHTSGESRIYKSTDDDDDTFSKAGDYKGLDR